MKRTKDLPRQRPITSEELPGTAAQLESCDAAVEHATALLIRGMQQSDSPIAELSGALARIAQTLGDIGTPLFAETAAQSAPELEVFRTALARDIAVCIQSLQFHDRLMQQLTQARDLLTGCASVALLAQIQSAPANEGNIEGSVELF